ncbi:MFS transporter [Coprobacter tertius]|uniref:MFS transporter n=1 Tax=Coprobacter tertius TaxID=2944915 RepID=A0ABT1MH21_9BACT|nr:MFS transporter [Coprobacter tertius]MCP9611922.1 MFS transporter [Coprobacter tertius]
MGQLRNNRQNSQIKPFMVMLLMYFIVGVFTVINQQFQVPLQSAMLPKESPFTNALVTLLNFSWFLAYPFSEGYATRMLERLGYRKTTVVALGVLVSGLAIYEFAVLLHRYDPTYLHLGGTPVSFGFFIFLLGSFVIGVSAAMLQVVLNLYLDVCQVGNTTSLQRQMIGGTINSIGMAIAPLIVSYFIFHGISLPQVQSSEFIKPVIVIIIMMVIVTWGTSRVRMPALPSVINEIPQGKQKSIWSFRQTRLGLWGLFFYVGIEVAVGANINMYALQLGHGFASQATHMAATYWTLLLIGRLVGSFLKKIPSETQLLVSTIASAVLLLLAILLSNPWILTIIGLFHSVMWPAIITLATDGLGAYTAKASGALMIGVVGGGIIPLLQGIAADAFGGDWRWTWFIVLIGELYILYYGVSGYKPKDSDKLERS